MGLQAPTTGTGGIYLSIAGGFIWNKKAEKTDPNYKEQKWVDAKGEERVRSGAQYGALQAKITNVYFKTHDQYGEAMYVVLQDGDETYTLNIKTNTNNSQCFSKALFLMDLNEEILISPFDFVDTKKNKRIQGISFKQNGTKIDLKEYQLPEEFQRENEWYGSATKKVLKRYFEDLSDYFVAEIEEIIIPQLNQNSEDSAEAPKAEAPKAEAPTKPKAKPAPKAEATDRPSPLKMKKFLKAYIEENYDERELPKLSREELNKWYDLAVNTEELPFEVTTDEAAVSSSEIQDELDALMPDA